MAARRDCEPFSVDGPVRRLVKLRTDCGDAAARDGDVAHDARVAAAVEYNTAADQNVMHGKARWMVVAGLGAGKGMG